jgi:uncharacterized protein YceK
MKKSSVFLFVAVMTVMLSGCGTALINDSGGRDGSTFAKAVIVGSVRSEYLWIDRTYIGADILSQVVAEDGGKTFDIVTIKTKDGTEKQLYFDISKFYKKKTYRSDLV